MAKTEGRRQSKIGSGVPSLTLRVGDDLEYRALRFFMRLGFFVRRGVEIYTESYLNKATDLDVLALKWVPPFRPYRQIVECKSGGGEPLDRVFWLAGVKRFAKANIATLLRPNTKWDIKTFARENEIELLDLASFTALEKDLEIAADYWPGVSDRYEFAARKNDWSKMLSGDSENVFLYLFLNSELREGREVASIAYLLFNLRRLTRINADKPDLLWRQLICDCIGQLAVYITFLVSKSIEMSEGDVKALIHRDLKYGPIDRRVIDRMMRVALRITEHTLEELGVSAQRVDKSLFDYPEPQNVDEVFALYQVVAKGLGTTESLAPYLDVLSWERFAHARSADAWLSAVFKGDQERLHAASKEFCGILERLGAVPLNFLPGLFDELPGGDDVQAQERPPGQGSLFSGGQEEQR